MLVLASLLVVVLVIIRTEYVVAFIWAAGPWSELGLKHPRLMLIYRAQCKNMSRRILTFSLFEAARTAGLTPEQKNFLNRYTKGTWTYNPATGLVDVEGSFNCSESRIKTLSGVRFGRVSGNFICSSNELTSLEGAPQEVGVHFDCRNSQLTSLVGAPQKVGADFYCQNNQLTSLEGAPRKVGQSFSCWSNQLTTLAGAPQEVGGNFICFVNKLTSLKGAPQKVGWDFECGANSLTSLEGAPQKVSGFDCKHNNLTSLKGAPQEVKYFDCRNNQLTSLEGAPQEVKYFDCSNNQLTSLEGAPQKVGQSFSCDGNNLTSLKGAPQKVGENFICDAFKLKKGEWNFKGWLKVLKEGSPEAQKLMTLLSAEALNKEIQKDPAGMIMKLKGVWNDEFFKETRAKLVWPKGYEQEADLLGDLDDVGF